MRSLILKTFEGTRITLGVIAAWYEPKIVASLATDSDQTPSLIGVFYVIEANGLTRVFPDNVRNRKALDWVFSDQSAQAERERMTLKNHPKMHKTQTS